MKNPIVNTERDVVTEVVESSSLVLGFAERRLVRLGTDDVLKVGVDVRLVGENDYFDSGMVLLELDQFVVTSANCRFVGTFRDENDEEVSDIFSVYLLAIHTGRSRSDIGSDETEPGKDTVGKREDPDDSPDCREGECVVSPRSSWVEDTPQDRHSRNEEQVGNPCPRLDVEESSSSHRFSIFRQVGGPSSRVELSEYFGIGRSGDRRSSRGSSPVHDGVKTFSEALVALLRVAYPPFDESTRTVNRSVEHVSSELGGESCSVVGFGDEQAVPNPFAELETDSIEKVVRDPTQ